MHPLENLHQSEMYEEFCENLKKHSDLEYKVKIALEALKDNAPINISCESKDSSKSDEFRTSADKLAMVKKGNILKLLQAFKLYSKSIAFAQEDSEDLPVVYANRSAVLCNLNKYAECITDIDKALNLNFPDELKTNLLRRKVKCLKLLGQEVEDTCEEARRWLESTKLNDESKKKLEGKIDNAAKITASEKLEKYDSELFKINFEKSVKVPCASSAIKLKCATNYGRCLVATRDIKVGEVLVVEKPYAALLKPECLYSHCSHCFKRAWNAIPCEKCVYAMYCSENCRSEAWKQYHDVECPIKGYLLGMASYDPLASFSLKVALLAIRQAGSISELKKQLQNIAKEEGHFKRSFSEDGLYHSDKYRQIHLLESHENNRPPEEYIIMSINAAVILYYVNSFTSFLGDSPDKSIDALVENEDAIFLGKLLIKHYMTIRINNHELSESDHIGEVHGIGAALFPFSSLFNHSCHPNARHLPVLGENNNIQLAIIAIHPIKKDSQIFDSYGFDFVTKSYSERRELCLKYHFTCKCDACVEEWPSSRLDLPVIKNYSLLESEKIELMEILDRLYFYTAIFKCNDLSSLRTDSEKVLKDLAGAVAILHKYSRSPPLSAFYDAVLLYRASFSAIHRNRYTL